MDESKEKLTNKLEECHKSGVIGGKRYHECLDILKDMELGDVEKAIKLLFVIMEKGW